MASSFPPSPPGSTAPTHCQGCVWILNYAFKSVFVCLHVSLQMLTSLCINSALVWILRCIFFVQYIENPRRLFTLKKKEQSLFFCICPATRRWIFHSAAFPFLLMLCLFWCSGNAPGIFMPVRGSCAVFRSLPPASCQPIHYPRMEIIGK